MSGLLGHIGLLMAPPAGGGVAEAISIKTNLVSWWTLDDNSATSTFADAHASNHLTQKLTATNPNSSVYSTAIAVIKNRAWFPNRTDDLTLYIPRANTNLDLPNSDFTFGLWSKEGSGAGTAAYLMGRIGGTVTAAQAWLSLASAGGIQFSATSNGTTPVNTATVSSSATTWKLITGTFNRSANQLELRVRLVGGLLSKQTVAFANPLYTTANNSNFCISEGLNSDTSFATSNRAAIVQADEAFYMTKAITDAEFNYLYNSGIGKSYVELTADAGF